MKVASDCLMPLKGQRRNKLNYNINDNMKKKLFGIMLVLAVILFAGYTVYNSHGDIKLSDVTLANLEALAGENDGGGESGG